VTACPRCGEPSEPGQLVCLECGKRLALTEVETERRRFDNLPAVVILMTLIVLAAGAIGFALGELGSDSDRDVEASNGTTEAATTEPAQPPQDEETGAIKGAPQKATQSPLLEWPKDTSGYTVVLVTTEDRSAAERVALEAARAGVEAGLLRSDDFNLGEGFWIVFAGRFDDQASAERQSANLAERYPGAYATQVTPAG
jgi:cell division protein FtsN